LLAPRGDYHTLLSFQKAEIVYDITFRFAHKFLSRGDRTVDQMIQSAWSGKKNILEGSKAGLTSKETEIKLTIDQQIRRLESDFLAQGGLRERMTRARVQYRKSHDL
jgi:four helix bundle suffix protein